MDKDDKNSVNSTEDDTWTLVEDSVKFGIPPIIISAENKENEENCQQDDENDNKKLSVHDDSDDGISVISESELLKNSSANSDTEDKLVDLPKLILHPDLRQSLDGSLDTEDEQRFEPMTPPSTPHDSLMSLRQRHQLAAPDTPSLPCTSHFSWIAFALIGVSMAFLLGNFLDLKDSIEAIGSQFEQRILNLEVQNDLLRSQIMRLKVQQNPVDQEEVNEVFSNDEEPIMLDLPTLPTFENFEEKIVPPPTKKVWLGNGEEDHYVQILDKKFALPDYCFYDNEDDIFNEYNAKVCDEKQKKLDRKLSSQEDKKDEKYKSNFKDLTPDEESDNLEPIQDQKRGAEGSGGRPKKFKKFKESKNYREGKKYKDSKKDLNSEDNTEDFEENPKKEDYNQDNWKSEENSKKDEYNEDTWKSEENPKRVEYNRDHWKAEEYSKGFKDSKYFKEVNEELKKNRDPNEQEEEPKNIFNENSKDLEYPSINKNSKDTKFEKFDQNDYKYEKKEKRPRRPQEQNQYQEKGDKKTMKDNKKFRKNEDKENQPNKKNIREGSGEEKPNKRKSDSDKNYRRNGTRQKSGSGEWHNKLMKSRDEIRDEIRKQKQTNWYLERASEREIQRVDLTSKQQVNASEP